MLVLPAMEKGIFAWQVISLLNSSAVVGICFSFLIVKSRSGADIFQHLCFRSLPRRLYPRVGVELIP